MKFIILLFISHILLFSQEVEPEILKTLEDNYNSKYRVLLSEEERVLSGPFLHSSGYDWGKVRAGKNSKSIYESGNEIIRVHNGDTGFQAEILSIEKIVFEVSHAPTYKPFEAFSFDSTFSITLPANPNNFFKDIKINGMEFSPVRKIYFRPQLPGEYEIYFYFNSNAESVGEETRYTLKGHGVVPNMFLFHDDSGTEVTDGVIFEDVNPNDPLSFDSKTFKIENRPNNPDDGDSLTISSINWHINISNEISNPKNEPFVVDEQDILNKYGTKGNYPIIIGVNEFIEFDITFVGAEKKIYPAQFFVISDADRLGETGPYNGEMTIVGNSTASSVKYDKEMFSIYPNPANDKINIDLKDIGKIEIIDLEGNVIFKKDILKAGVNEIDISHFSSGTYIIKYYSNKEVYFNKFIKK